MVMHRIVHVQVHVKPEFVEAFIEEGFLSFDDLTFLEISEMAELASVTEEQAQEIIQFAEEQAEMLRSIDRGTCPAKSTYQTRRQQELQAYRRNLVPKHHG